MTKLRLAELILDFNLYPRAEVDSQHVHTLRDAIAAGVELPPLVADEASKRVIDGFHRYRAFKRAVGDDAMVDVALKVYPDERAMFLDAMRYNSGHGRSLAMFDRAHCVLRADALGIEPAEIAAALSITAETVGKLRAERIGRLRSDKRGKSEPIPLKRTLKHMAGKELTQQQSEVNDKLSGMDQLFYVNQVIMLIEADLIDMENEHLMKALEKLGKLLGAPRKKAA